jgi:hypothetical protein
VKGFKDTTRTSYVSGGASRPGLRGAAQHSAVTKAYKTGGRVVAGPGKPCGCGK